MSIEEVEQQENLVFPEIDGKEIIIKPSANEALIKKITALCGYEHPDGKTFYGKCQSRSFECSVVNVEKMLRSIEADKVKTKGLARKRRVVVIYVTNTWVLKRLMAY